MEILAKNLLILASAGSGKTFQLGNRVIGHVAAGTAPESIVALTFTRKAAGEFTDSVLTKLAAAAADPAKAERLARDIQVPGADFTEALARVIKALPKFTLGTIDSFFSKIVRGFQYELGLTGGKFDLLEGPRAEAARDELVAEILGEFLKAERGEEFLHAFRRATIGREGAGVRGGLDGFVRLWHGRFRSKGDLAWGPAELAGVPMEMWEERKGDLAAKAERGVASVVTTDKRQSQALLDVIQTLREHTIGSGSLGSATGLLASLLATVAAGGNGGLEVKYQKPFTIGGITADALREMVTLAARCEMAAAALRTRAIREMIAVYDELSETRLRKRGLLGFDDVKLLMGEWASGEDARLRREAVDFRLDGRYQHWLLDEFQDTSGGDWTGLQPLIDEAASGGDGTVFVVGDTKQAIYGWRGGDVGLFGEVRDRYGRGSDPHLRLRVEPLTESWRSCPEVLALVNKVCGDVPLMRELFGQVADQWDWRDHVSAEPLRHPAKRGESRVEIVQGKRPERLIRLVEILEELGVGRRRMTCGILVRSNSQVTEIADHLRSAGFDVIEEGVRAPAKDNAAGIGLWHLLKWLANPADVCAREILTMSPLWERLRAKHGQVWQAVWEALHARAAETGFSTMAAEAVADLMLEWSEFGRRRAGDVIAALAALDASGATTAGEAADWIERLQVSQSPGAAAVQVMTIHKSKGLGFDVVLLPEIPKDVVPDAGYFEAATGPGWITQVPPKWARQILPEMREAEERWSAVQRYEAFCILYVALTRAKRGLYVLLEPPAKKADPDKASLANWLVTAVGGEGTSDVIWQSGSTDWVEHMPADLIVRQPPGRPPLGIGVPRRERAIPSGSKFSSALTPASLDGMRFGNEVHAALEGIRWLDDEPAKLPDDDAGRWVAKLLSTRSLRPIFYRDGRPVEVLNEQKVEAIVRGTWLSGAIDRLILHRDVTGEVTRVEVIDFKTDAGDLAERYREQMTAYREIMEQAFPAAEIRCLLVSTARREAIELP